MACASTSVAAPRRGAAWEMAATLLAEQLVAQFERSKFVVLTAVALAQLVDRLRQRLPVHRVLPVASHWPERTATALDPHGLAPAEPPGWATPPEPVLLLCRPAPLEAVTSQPDGPPALLRWHGAGHRLRQAEGPARLEPEWWRGRRDLQRRDYYRVELASGVRLWIYRSGTPGAPEWRLHGYLP